MKKGTYLKKLIRQSDKTYIFVCSGNTCRWVDIEKDNINIWSKDYQSQMEDAIEKRKYTYDCLDRLWIGSKYNPFIYGG